MSGSRIRPYLGPLIALLVVLALGAGTVYATIPNGSGTYYACLTKSSGVVRLINYPKMKCATGERFIKWSQRGPAGPAGVQGPRGDQGPKGDPGPAGPADWNAIANKPDGFADGVDNGAFVSSIVTEFTLEPAYLSVTFSDVGPFSRGADVDFHVIPTSTGFVDFQIVEIVGQPAGVYYALYVGNTHASTVSFKIRATVHSQGVVPAALKRQLKNVEVGSVKIKRR